MRAFLLFTFLPFVVFSQINYGTLGAENFASGNINSLIANEYSTNGNPSGLSHMDSINVVSFSSIIHPLGSAFNSYNVCGSFFYKKIASGISVDRFGNDVFNSHKIGFALAHKINSVSLGFSGHYQQLYAENYLSKKRLMFNLGGTIRINSKLRVGSYITNINQAKYTNGKNDILATVMSIGIRYQVLKNVALMSEIEKNTLFKPNIKAGLVYHLQKRLSIAMGINSLTSKIYLGTGFSTEKMALWLSYSYNYYISSAFQITFKLRLSKS